MASKYLDNIFKAAMVSFFWARVLKLKARVLDSVQASFDEHLKTMNLGEQRDCSPQFTKDKDGILVRDGKRIRERKVRCFYTLLNTKS